MQYTVKNNIMSILYYDIIYICYLYGKTIFVYRFEFTSSKRIESAFQMLLYFFFVLKNKTSCAML